MQDYVPFHVTRSDLLRRAGQVDAAKEAFRRSIDTSDSEPERFFLMQQLQTSITGD